MMTVKEMIASNRRTLLRWPLYKMCPIKVRADSRLLLAVLVEDPAVFDTPAVGFAVGIKPWCSPEHVPLVGIAYRLTHTPVGRVEGVVHLNPNQVDDYALLLELQNGEGLVCVILGRDVRDDLMGKIDLSANQRHTLQEFLVLFDRASTEEKREEEGDPEFARATQEFQKRYRVQDILSEGARAGHEAARAGHQLHRVQ
jgi:hypothetical protein